MWRAADLRWPARLRVEPGEVVYAFVCVAGERTPGDEAVLDDVERARSARLARPSDRNRFVAAHGALRRFLACCLEISPAAVIYEHGVSGKPRLARGLPSLEFNLSHSGDLAIVAVARDRQVGVDVERLRELPDAMNIAQTHFTPDERDALGSLPPAERRDAFFRCWTRKEAVIKAVGHGLALALDSFDVDLAPGSASALRSFGGRPAAESGLSLRDLRAPPGFAAAGAVAAGGAGDARWREVVDPAGG